MKTTDKNNAIAESQKTTVHNIGMIKENGTNQDQAEIAEQGFTVRNGHNPNKPNPSENPIPDDTNDDFHTDRDLEDDNLDLENNEIQKEED